MLSLIKKKKFYFKPIELGIVLFVLLSPSNLFSIILTGLLFLYISRVNIIPFLYSISLFLSSITVTKDFESDLFFYNEISNVIKHLNFYELITLYAHEPFFYICNWVLVSLFNFEFISVIFIQTFFFYFLILLSVNNLFKEIPISKIGRICVLLTVAFLPFVFGSVGHLLRQYTAGSLIFYSLFGVKTYKNKILLLVIASLTHISAVIFLFGIFFVKRKFLSQLGVIISFFLLFVILYVTNSEIFRYALKRSTQLSYYELEKLSLMPVIVIMILFLLSCMLLNKNQTNTNLRLNGIYIIITTAIVMLAHICGINELSVRFSQYIYILCPGIIFYLLLKVKDWYRISFALLMILIFSNYNFVWNYANFAEVLIFPYYNIYIN